MGVRWGGEAFFSRLEGGGGRSRKRQEQTAATATTATEGSGSGSGDGMSRPPLVTIKRYLPYLQVSAYLAATLKKLAVPVPR